MVKRSPCPVRSTHRSRGKERRSGSAVQLMEKGAPFEHGRLLILGGPDDWRTAEPLRRSLPRERWVDLTGQGDLLTIYAALKRARLYIGNDSGLMHLAAAAGVPTVGLFGPSDERLYGPWGEATRVVRGSRSFGQIQTVDPTLSQPVCHMLDLPVTSVVEAAKALYAQTELGAAAQEAAPTALEADSEPPKETPAKSKPRARKPAAKSA